MVTEQEVEPCSIIPSDFEQILHRFQAGREPTRLGPLSYLHGTATVARFPSWHYWPRTSAREALLAQHTAVTIVRSHVHADRRSGPIKLEPDLYGTFLRLMCKQPTDRKSVV